MNKFQVYLEKIINPITSKLSTNKFVVSLTGGFMSTMVITLGASIIAILVNLPIEAWQNFLTSSGLSKVGLDFVSTTLTLIAIYLVGSIAYHYAKNDNRNPITVLVITMASFLSLIPLSVIEVNGRNSTFIELSKLGSNGVFVAMLCGLSIPYIYGKLEDKNIKIKLPDSVPPMVSDSISPIFIGMIIFIIAFSVKYGFTFTSYGDIFTFFTTIITKPVMLLGSSPWGKVAVYMFANLCWFFGLHPSPILSTYSVMTYPIILANIEAFVAGQPLPYLDFMIVSLVLNIGATGNTLGLSIGTLFAKSEKYKSMSKLVIVPNLFNINEPVVFGFPLVLNPIYLFPMVFTCAVSSGAALLISKLIPISINPTASMPWVTPYFISNFVMGGLGMLIITIVAILISFLMYYPFFRIDDQKALQEEQNT